MAEGTQSDFDFDSKTDRGHCNVCRIELTSAAHAKQHLEGKKHDKEKKRRQSFLAFQNPGAGSSGDHLGADSSAAVGNGQVPGPGGDQAADEDDAVETVFGHGQTWYKCVPCNKLLNTQEQMSIHQKSPKHQKAKSRGTSGSGSDLTVWHTCDICKKKLNTALQLEIHVKSHGEGAVSSAGAGADRTVWHTCPECKKKVNTAEQLDIHMRSHSTSGGTTSGFKPLEGDISDIMVVPADMSLREHLAQEEEANRKKREEMSSAADATLKDAEMLVVMLNEPRSHHGGSGSIGVGAPGDTYRSEVNPARTLKPAAHDDVLGVTGVMAADSGRFEVDHVDLTAQLAALRQDAETGDDEDSPVEEEADDDAIRGMCSFELCIWHCGVCDKHLTGPESKHDHLQGTTHLKNLKKKGLLAAAIASGGLVADGRATVKTRPKSKSTPDGFYDFCDVCQVPFSGPEALASHERGKQHKAKVAKSKEAPRREIQVVQKDMNLDNTDAFVLTKKDPREYQVELYNKAMAADSVIFLPTGTGKTLVGVMVIAKMLKLNPARPVVFLVDKVLLVLQQSQVIRTELQDKIFRRYDYGSERYEDRRLRIAALCGEQQSTEDLGDVPLWQHDVIVVTAAYYQNLLQARGAYWQDNCLAVFDEAHHCTKKHPFNVLLQDYHVPLPAQDRPKVLGLTASPAGKPTLDQTKEMLKVLLKNMGEVRVQMVEQEEEELERFRSSAEIVLQELMQHPSEEKLVQGLVHNMQAACQALLNEPQVKDIGGVVTKALQNIDSSAELFGTSASEMYGKLEEILDESKEQLETTAQRMGGNVASLWSHLSDVINVYYDLEELGFNVALEQLSKVKDQAVGGFADVESRGVSCDVLRGILEEFSTPEGAAVGPGYPTKKECLVDAIRTRVDWSEGKKKEQPDWPMVLVLVQRREFAMKLVDWLRDCAVVKELSLKVARLVGHGAGRSDGGMSVKRQEKTLAQIRQHQFDIIVATSVAEEGLDIPECELVIQLDVPTTVTTLVQVRGRARKRGSHYILVCRSNQMEDMRDLMLREKHMIDAVRDAVGAQRDRAAF